MEDRRFNEVELRIMLADAKDYAEQSYGRSIVFTTKGDRNWEVVVEPDHVDHVLLVITAYPVD